MHRSASPSLNGSDDTRLSRPAPASFPGWRERRLRRKYSRCTRYQLPDRKRNQRDETCPRPSPLMSRSFLPVTLSRYSGLSERDVYQTTRRASSLSPPPLPSPEETKGGKSSWRMLKLFLSSPPQFYEEPAKGGEGGKGRATEGVAEAGWRSLSILSSAFVAVHHPAVT